MKVKNQILVIGGYGQVGSRICTMLSGKYPGKVIAAGKNLAKAEAFSRSQEGKVIPLKLDIREQPDLCLFDSVRLVVMCLDQTDTRFVEACLESGTNYMDISASYDFLSAVERLDDHAKASGAAAMLSVGLAPGLTNLMARAAADRMEYCEEVRITVMLGLGEKHGKAAIEWTVDQMNNKFTIGLLGTPRTVQSFTDGIKTNFRGKLGHRSAYRYNFADQHTLPRTLNIPNVSTRLCFDVKTTTAALAWMKRAGMLQLLRFSLLKKAAVQLFSRANLGSELFAVKIDAYGQSGMENMHTELLLTGSHEASITADAAAAAANRLYREDLPAGIYHIEQVWKLGVLLDDMMGTYALSVWVNGQLVS